MATLEEEAERKASEIGLPMNAAVVDEGGNLTSRAFDVSANDLAQYSQLGGQFFGIHASNHGRVVVFAGGVPLTRGGKVVGAVGVSGGSGEQDHTVAEAGAEAF
jgi:uncharacterized protein GlcG (DUF336 family)